MSIRREPIEVHPRRYYSAPHACRPRSTCADANGVQCCNDVYTSLLKSDKFKFRKRIDRMTRAREKPPATVAVRKEETLKTPLLDLSSRKPIVKGKTHRPYIGICVSARYRERTPAARPRPAPAPDKHGAVPQRVLRHAARPARALATSSVQYSNARGREKERYTKAERRREKECEPVDFDSQL
ncbi:hypothetical protein EVAR_17597_1 [Eumeta japonica]|uniref:Uncharacterized protein n=1 Tax=Eumeta variegata TaxID=151549 RepID=A0A4C1UC68_EUMVA|nr:hypothetical protein EVAR_17597_1 [Eumeta japonica]